MNSGKHVKQEYLCENKPDPLAIKRLKTLAANKREDKNYRQLCGYIPKDLALKFKLAHTAVEIDQSEAIEAAIRLWVAQTQQTPGKLE
jgi:hypothetical protein